MIEKALSAKRESKSVDFKRTFDPDCAADWCELVKDLVSMANSGGGAILIGVDNDGSCPGDPTVARTLALDPAVVTDKVARYTGVQFDGFTIAEGQRHGQAVAVISVEAVFRPLVFERPGTYAVPEGRQKTAFALGTVYVRHGAKSEPATSEDIAESIERSIQRVRKEWLAGVRKISVSPSKRSTPLLSSGVRQSDSPDAVPIRITDDPNAAEYRLINPDNTHPWRQKELLLEVNKQLPDDRKINQSDIQAVRHLYNIDADPLYFHKPRFNSPQYSPSFAKWLIRRFEQDNRFFLESREEFKRRRKI